MNRVEFRDCKLLGTDFSHSKIQHTSFQDCIGHYSNFRFAEFKQVSFNSCSLVHSDYYQSKNKLNLDFSNCDINKASLSGLKLKGIDLSDCQFEELLVESEDLEGCTIAPHHASSLIGLLGINIKY
ncbi:Pentapeptide repeats (8 copies) [compost metagenome]